MNRIRPDALPNLSEEDLLLLRVGGHVVQEEAGCGRGRVYSVFSRTKRLGPDFDHRVLTHPFLPLSGAKAGSNQVII